MIGIDSGIRSNIFISAGETGIVLFQRVGKVSARNRYAWLVQRALTSVGRWPCRKQVLTSHLRSRRRWRIDLGRHVIHLVVDGIRQDLVDDDGDSHQNRGSHGILSELRAILIAYKLQKSFHLSLLPERNSTPGLVPKTLF